MAKAMGFDQIINYFKLHNTKVLTTEDDFNEVRMQQRKTPASIELRVSCSCGEVYKISTSAFKSKKHKLCKDCTSVAISNNFFPQERVEEIIKHYENGLTMKEIAKLVKTKPSYISKILKENNIKIKITTDYKTSEQLDRNRVNFFNQRFFEKIDSEEKAYWLGFMYADGNVYINKGRDGGSKGASIEITLKQEDEYHLENFIKVINGNMSVEKRKIKLHNKTYNASRIQLNSIAMANDLISHGCIPRKSLVLTFPETVPHIYMKHFIRGYFDGDGCVSFNVYYKTDSFFISILGTLEFLKGIKEHLENNDISISRIRKMDNIYELAIFKKNDLVKFYNYIYADSKIFLGRKIDKYRDAMHYYSLNYKGSIVSKIASKLDSNLEMLKKYRNEIRPNLKGDIEYSRLFFSVFDLETPQKRINGN